MTSRFPGVIAQGNHSRSSRQNAGGVPWAREPEVVIKQILTSLTDCKVRICHSYLEVRLHDTIEENVKVLINIFIANGLLDPRNLIPSSLKCHSWYC